jgi:hypothetical protein
MKLVLTFILTLVAIICFIGSIIKHEFSGMIISNVLFIIILALNLENIYKTED